VNMERILEITSLRNMNRQFVSLLRSEQEGHGVPIVGDSTVWSSLMTCEDGGLDGAAVVSKLLTLDEALSPTSTSNSRASHRRRFPLFKVIRLVFKHPKLIIPGAKLSMEVTGAFIKQILGRWLVAAGPSSSSA
jgi:hypothetical protein